MISTDSILIGRTPFLVELRQNLTKVDYGKMIRETEVLRSYILKETLIELTS
jgi:hypothetical protein